MFCSGLTKKGERCRIKIINNNFCHIHKSQEKKEEETTKNFQTEECIICCEPFENDFKPLEPCQHYIHQSCIAHTGKLQCPICRTPVKIDPKYEDIYKETVKTIKEEKEREDEEQARIIQEEFNQEYFTEMQRIQEMRNMITFLFNPVLFQYRGGIYVRNDEDMDLVEEEY
jgi:uncharacterized Zn finger protein (UPF0148 family)